MTAVMRSLRAGGCILFGLAALAFGAGSEEGAVRIVAQGVPAVSSVGPVAAAQRAVLQRFLEKNPDILVEPFAMPEIQGLGQDSTILMAIAAGVAPEAIYVNFRQSSTFVEKGFLAPLEILLARVMSENPKARAADADGQWMADPSGVEIEAALESLRARIPERVWPVVHRPPGGAKSAESHVWALPTSQLIGALMYRKDLFFEAGLDPERPPETWEELLKAARVLTVPERRQFGIILPVGPFTSQALSPFINSMGVALLEEGNDGEWRAAFGNRQAAEAVRFAWELARGSFQRDGRTVHGAAYTGSDGGALLWSRGQAGMVFSTLEEEVISMVNPQMVGIAPVPRSPLGIRASQINARMMGIFSQSSPAQQLATMRYIWYLTGEEALRIRTTVMVEGGMGQFVNPDLLRRFGFERVLRTVPPSWREAFGTAVANGVPEPYGRNSQNLFRHVSKPINEILELPLETMGREESVVLIEKRLGEATQLINERLLGQISPEKKFWRRVIGGAMLALVAVGFAWCLGHVWRHFSLTQVRLGGVGKRRLTLLGYGLAAPALALVLVWDYLPMAGGVAISMLDFQLVKASVFVGVDNFANVMFDGAFWASMLRTLQFVALSLGLGFWPPILLAILLSEIPTNTAKYVYRTIFYLPAVVSGVVVMFLWRQLYDPSEFGILNQILMAANALGPVPATVLKTFLMVAWATFVGLFFYVPWKMEELAPWLRGGLAAAGLALVASTVWPLMEAYLAGDGGGGWSAVGGILSGLAGPFQIEPLRWIQSPQLAMLCVIIPTVWATSGPGCLLYLAALKTIPDELYEAAEIDGATNLHKIFHIVVPRLKFLIILQFISALTGAFKGGTESIMVMTGGGPNGATSIAALEVFFRAFIELDFGTASAMAWIIGLILILFTAFQLKMLSRAEFKAAR